MKLKTAFKLSALATAMSLSSGAFAITHDNYEINEGWEDPTTIPSGGYDLDDYQYVDVGSRTIQNYVGGNGVGSNLPVELHSLNGVDYYIVDGKVYTAQQKNDPVTGNPLTTTLPNGKVVPVKDLILDTNVSLSDFSHSTTFVHGGTANDYQAGSIESISSIKRLDTNSVTYGDITSIIPDQAEATIAVTDSQGNSDPFAAQTVASGGVQQTSDKVVLGVVNKLGDKYGVYAETIDVNGQTSTTALTASGIETTGTIAANKLKVVDIDVSGTLSATNGVKVAGGLDVVGGLSADTATISGLLSANGGANIVGGLNTDTVTVSDTLNATLANLNTLNVSGSANISSLTSERIDTKLLVSERNHVPFTVLAATNLLEKTQADGRIELDSQFENKGQTQNSLSGKYIVNGEEIYTFRTFEDGQENVLYYKKENGQFTQISEVESIKNGTIAPEKGGVTANTVGVSTQSNIQNIITDNILRYSEETTSQEAVEIKGALTPIDAGSVEQFDQPLGFGSVTKTLHLVDTGIIAKDGNGNNVYGVVAKRIDANGTAETTLTADGISTNGAITTEKLVVGGRDLGQELTDLDTKVTNEVTRLDEKVDTGLTAVNGRVDAVETSVSALDTKVTNEVSRLDADVASVNGRVDAVETSVSALDTKVTNEVSRLDSAIASANESTLAAANANAVAGDAATLDAANQYTASGLTAAADERAAIRTEVASGLTAAADDRAAIRTEFAAADAATLEKAQEADVKVLADANAYTDTQFATLNSTTSRLNQRISDVEETAYRGIAIALAAQQQIPNIGAGQFAVFGGVGHYEGESAAALGLASVLENGRTSFSAAVGTAGNGEVGGRVGMAYVFGGK